MKSLVVIPTIRPSPNFGKYAENFAKYNHAPDIMIIDEDGEHREEIKKQFDGFNVEVYGIKERLEWFREYGLGNPNDLIPEKAHNENSFGLLIAQTRDYDMVVFVDDDTMPEKETDFLGEHWRCLNADLAEKRSLNGSWVNTHPYYHARGFPYNQRRSIVYEFTYYPSCYCPIVLNMGAWTGIPDLNAIDYLVLNPQPEKLLPIRNFAVARGQFAPLCSMNLAFRPEIIPAFYQLWHKDRYDDIFSGLFLKKIADHLGKGISVGTPIVYHDKTPRNLFKDAAAELPSMELNETLWQVLLKIELTEKTWLDCYRELADKLHKSMLQSPFESYVYVMTRKMLAWCKVIEEVKK